MRRWSLPSFLILLLVVPSVAGVWNQYQGDPQRSAHLKPFPEILDVLEVGQLRSDRMDLGGDYYAPVALRSAEGWTWAERRPGAVCAVVTRPVLQDSADEYLRSSEDCASGLLQALDPQTGRVLLCNYGTADDIVLRAVEPDGRVAWSVVPNETLEVRSSGAEEDAGWILRCQGTALDLEERVVYVAFHENCPGARIQAPALGTIGYGKCTGLHRIAAFRMDDGALLWWEKISEPASQEGLFDPGSETVFQDGRGIFVGGITLLDDAVVVAFGKECRTCATERQVAFAWLDRATGRQIGVEDRDEFEGNVGDVVSGSRFAVAKDGLAYFYHYGAVIVVDPAREEPLQRIPVQHRDEAVRATAAPVIWNQYVVVPSEQVLHAVDVERGELAWEWNAGHNWLIEQVSASADGELVVLVVDVARELGAKLVRLQVASGAEIQELPVLFEVSLDTDGYFGQIWRVDLLQGDGDEAVLFDQHGKYARLGAAAGKPLVVAPSDTYPSTGAPVTLGFSAPAPQAQRIFVSWGDGNRQTFAPSDPLEHRYAENGDFDILATLILDDNTTRTAKAIVHVGGTPPRDLNALQRAFAPENLDMTWGVIGVLIAVFGGLAAFARARLRKNRLEYKLAELERLKARAAHDVPGAIRDVDAYRTALRTDLRRGKLDDIQYAVLESEIQRSLRLWYHRLIAPYEARMSDRFRRHLAGSLEDGTLHAPEAHRLVEELARESRLKADEKAHLRAFFEEWSHGDAA